MKPTKEMFGESMGDVYSVFKKLEDDSDFVEFYRIYWDVCYDEVIKEMGVHPGHNRSIAVGKTFERVWSNLGFMLSEFGSKNMRVTKARELWWFLEFD